MLKKTINFFTKDLKRELIIAIVLTHAMMMSIFIYDLTRQQETFLHKQSLSQTKSLTRTLAKNSTTWVLSNDYVGMFEIIDSVDKYPGLEYAMLIDMDNKILAHTNKKYLNEYLAGPYATKIMEGKKKLVVVQNNKSIIDIAVPITVDNRQIGWARVGLSQKNNSNGIKVVLEKGVLYTVIAIFIGWIFAYILATGFTKSLYVLINIAKRTAQGERGLIIDTSRNDEIGVLAYEMSIMLNKLDANDKELALFNKSLEVKIKEKTKELALKNDILKESEENLKLLNDDLEKRIELEVEKMKEVQEKLFKSEKLAAMGDMIGNIAHQWRQPLSVITTASTGMQMQKEFGTLSDERFTNSCDMINNNAQYLSETIDDFKNFIKGDSIEVQFNIEDKMNSFLHLVESVVTSDDIHMVLDFQKDITLNGHPNELIQCIMNIFNNSKDALTEKEVENKHIFISTNIIDTNLQISIYDNAGGIPKDIINKVFEPYFTTKHKAQGTGLGLHMTYNLITDCMNGNIDVSTIDFDYQGKQYKGAQFVITLPLS